MQNYYKAGSWNVICAVCGIQYKSDEIRKRWDGLLVCKQDYEDRNILDFTRVKPEMGSVPFSNPDTNSPDSDFIFVCYIEASQGLADTGQADCAQADKVLSATTLADLGGSYG